MYLLRVNMSNLRTALEPLPEEYKLLGNRGLVAEILCREVPARTNPLGAKNKLILAGGPLAGLGISSAARLSAGGKSPLTGGIKEANAGGIAVQRMTRLGIRAIIVEGQAETGKIYLLYLKKDGVELLPAGELKGLGTYDVAKKLRARYGKDIGVITIGPAGEMLMNLAGIFATDSEGQTSRACARGGLGAVMGSKGLKAIVIANDGDYRVPVHDEEAFKKARKEFIKVLMTTPQTSEIYTNYGTASALAPINKLGGLPTYNFRQGSFEKAEAIDGDALYDLIEKRNGAGKHSHACMNGCVIRCSNVVPDEEGNTLVSPLEYETLALLGSNLGIADLDAIASLNKLCNDIGIDTIETGAALGVAIEAGMAPFGDAQEIYRIIEEEIGQGTILGRVLGQGTLITGRVLGISRLPVVKGQAIAAHDPRAIKGMTITYAMSPMGGDHTAGVTLRAPIDHHKPEGQMELSRNIQVIVAAHDSLGFCMFVIPAVGGKPEYVVNLINAVYGTNFQPEWLMEYGKDVIKKERAFNLAAGFNEVHDRLPEMFLEEELPPHNLVSDLSEEDYRRYWDTEFWGEFPKL
ncbi:aldehyde ferredoxin oxidoreductase C-terminal domain-containing protein [Calderihabitans maritimus]|uniref:Aldehyde ferredoxin oxidoreductase n=1 Tax=Calderihabitans maritimus TaxID=1246530 RepID=A0A1Z5HU39_9FIRM|nr:aldehyde ferredoxin oxidoreductase C-terminal domain-containing protein [Calderihabitans maritimus]GAW92800.1 aldehyde ferredoxin oxidoreductase [Calderihabitans maritimus]